MTQTIATKFAALACTLVLSTTLLIGAVGPAQVNAPATPQIARTVA